MHASDLTWTLGPLTGLARAVYLYRDSRRTCAAVEVPPVHPLVAQCMRGNRFRDGVRTAIWLLFVVFMVVPILTGSPVHTFRYDVRNAIVWVIGGLLYAAGESDAAERRHLHRTHRPDAEREADRR